MGYLDNTGLAYLWGKIKAKLVQPDWQQNNETAADYVKNRPGAYDEYDVNITWDGVIGDRLTVDGGDGAVWVKVSDQVLTVEQINNLTGTMSDGDTFEIENIEEPNSGYDVCVFVATPGWQGAPESGVYFLKTPNAPYLISLASTNTTPVKLPKKYLELDNTLGITSAAVGQIAQITAVDDRGKPTAWEAVDMESNNIVLASSTAGSTKKFRLTVDDSGTLSAVEVTDAS